MPAYDELRYAYMAEVLRRVKEDNSSKDMERLYKMFEGMCKRISWSFSDKYNLSFAEIEGLVCTEFMLLVRLYRTDSNMTLTSFLNSWLYFKVDRALRQFLGKNKNKKFRQVYLNTDQDNSDSKFTGAIDKFVSQGDFNFHLELSEFVDSVRKVMGERDVDILLLHGLYGMSYEKISDIVEMSVESVKRHLRKIKKLLAQNNEV